MQNKELNINEIKSLAKQLIQDNLHREVSPETKYGISGIYMIYINNFNSDKIVPIYIGQSKNIQNRYKQHFTEILALNRLSYSEYKNYFFSKRRSFYDGKFKTCKIFKYMIENNCSLQDFRMVILEKVEEKYLDEKEQEYFQKLLPSFLGFNQLNAHLEWARLHIKLRSNSQVKISDSEVNDYLEILSEDIKNIYSYYEFGFTRFNLEYALPRDLTLLFKENAQLNNNTLLKCEEVQLNLDSLFKYYKLDDKVYKRLNEQLRKSYEEYQIAKAEYEEILQQEKGTVKKLLEKVGYFFKKVKSSELLVQAKQEAYYKAQDLNIEYEKKIRVKKYKLIFPSCEFQPYSLKDRNNTLGLKVNGDDKALNTCHIQLYISNNGISRNDIRKDPNVIMIDYLFVDKDKTEIKKRYYIENTTTINCKEGIEYFEKDFYDSYAFRKTPFSISSFINGEVENSFISIQAEFKHGLNDYSFKDKQLVKLSIVFEEILRLVNDETVFIIGLSESYNCLEKCMIDEALPYNPIIEKLLTKKSTRFMLKRKPSTRKESDKPKATKVNNIIKRAEAYKEKVFERSNNTINILSYISSKEPVLAQCKICGYECEKRSDHLLSKPYCPSCRKSTKESF